MALPVTLSDIVFLQPQPPPFKVGDSYYIVARDANDFRDIKVLKANSDDPTSSWAEQDSGNRPSASIAPDHIHAVVDGTTIHIATGKRSTSLGYVEYHTFNTSSNTWSIKNESVL